MGTAMAGAGLENGAPWESMATRRADPMAGGSPGANGSTDSSSSSSPGDITSNDFLTLLVTELQNQDPTANTDPNEYINQLVEVNSLQQLISINQTVTTAFGTASSSSASGNAAAARAASRASNGAAVGNLSTPRSSAPAETVAQSLSKGRHGT